MFQTMKGTTDQEKAAIFLHIFEDCHDWRRLYSIAIGPERFNALQESSKKENSNRWKNSPKIKGLIQETKAKINARIEEERAKAVQAVRDSGGTETRERAKEPAETNFLDLEQFLKYANEQANRIQDDKERRAWVEMIGKYMAFKDGSSEGANEIQRFYTPVHCDSCEIYKKCKGCTFPTCPKC